MTDPALPHFKYHADPIGSASIIESDKRCAACRQQVGWIYVGPVYADAELENSLCPWCIGDGTAHKVFGAEFFDPPAIGDYGRWEIIPQAVIDEICFQTPSFNGWQQERWYTHCRDAAEFVGPMGAAELKELGAGAFDSIAEESGYSGQVLAAHMDRLDKDCGPTAYVFRCRHCGMYGGYSDIH